MTSIALDASTTISGYSIFIDGKYKCSGYIDLHKDKDSEHRLYEMAKQIGDVIEKYNPDVIYLEDIYQVSNVSTVKTLANLGGAIKFYAYTHNYPVVMVMPSSWRSALGIQKGKAKRNELKNLAMNLCYDQLGLSVEIDECEAICINLSMAVKNGQAILKEVNDDDIWD